MYETYEVRTTFADGKEHRIKLSLWIPPGAGPFPVLLYGDGCWYMLREETVHHALERGNIVAAFDRTEAAADNSARYRDWPVSPVSRGFFRRAVGLGLGLSSLR